MSENNNDVQKKSEPIDIIDLVRHLETNWQNECDARSGNCKPELQNKDSHEKRYKNT